MLTWGWQGTHGAQHRLPEFISELQLTWHTGRTFRYTQTAHPQSTTKPTCYPCKSRKNARDLAGTGPTQSCYMNHARISYPSKVRNFLGVLQKQGVREQRPALYKTQMMVIASVFCRWILPNTQCGRKASRGKSREIILVYTESAKHSIYNWV